MDPTVPSAWSCPSAWLKNCLVCPVCLARQTGQMGQTRQVLNQAAWLRTCPVCPVMF